MDVAIVSIAEEYIAGYCRCLDDVARERRHLGIVKGLSEDRSRAFVLHNIEQRNPHLVVVDQGRVVGWCDIERRRLEGFTHCGHLGMGLLPDYRRKGLGRQLVETALRLAQEAGIERVELEVYASNTAAVALYERFGFEREGVKKRARFLDGVYEDLLCMAHFLPREG